MANNHIDVDGNIVTTWDMDAMTVAMQVGPESLNRLLNYGVESARRHAPVSPGGGDLRKAIVRSRKSRIAQRSATRLQLSGGGELSGAVVVRYRGEGAAPYAHVVELGGGSRRAGVRKGRQTKARALRINRNGEIIFRYSAGEIPAQPFMRPAGEDVFRSMPRLLSNPPVI